MKGNLTRAYNLSGARLVPSIAFISDGKFYIEDENSDKNNLKIRCLMEDSLMNARRNVIKRGYGNMLTIYGAANEQLFINSDKPCSAELRFIFDGVVRSFGLEAVFNFYG